MWRKYAAQATHPFVVVMLIAGAITIWQREFALSVVIWLVAVVNAGFSFWREYQAERAVEKLKHLLPYVCTCDSRWKGCSSSRR